MAKSEVARAFKEDGAHKTHIGGQALIEGVMMRGKSCWAVAVREPNNRIYTEYTPLKNQRDSGWRSWLLVRGCVALIDSLVIGYKALEIAANHALADEDPLVPCADDNPTPETSAGEDPVPVALTDYVPLAKVPIEEKPSSATSAGEAPSAPCADEDPAPSPQQEAPEQEAPEQDAFGTGAMIVSVVAGVVLGLALFILLPALVSNVLIGDYDTNTLAWNIVDGLCRVAIFILYVWLIGRMKDIKRLFAYHGAEHKTIHCYEHGYELIPQNAQQFPRLHIRCGTAFLIMVMIIAILVYTIIPLDALFVSLGVTDSTAKFLLVLAARVIFLPLIAGISYEITVKWAGSHPQNPLVRVVLWPGMQMQRLTTHEPDTSQLECAIAAMSVVLAQEEPLMQKNAREENR